jgi:hypothetical protein
MAVERNAVGQILPGQVNNPTGKGGFGDNPQNGKGGGRWNPKASIGYNRRKYVGMTDEELADVIKQGQQGLLTQAEKAALASVMSMGTFAGRVEAEDRLEGKPRQQIDQQITQAAAPVINVKFVGKKSINKPNEHD